MPGMTPEKVKETFEKAKYGLRLIRSSLNFFLESRKKEAGLIQVLGTEIADGIDSYGFGNRENHQLDVKKLSDLFHWALDTVHTGGLKIGRNLEVPPQEFDGLVADLQDILHQVNAMR